MRMTQDMDDDEKGKLFVGGLSWETSQENLQRYFSRYGEVIDCVVMKNSESGRSRGFGFVTFAEPSLVDIVLQSGPHQLDGRTIDPKRCNPRTLQKPKRGGGYPKVFLGGLPSNVTETDLRMYFARYGKVMEVVIMYDQEKKKSRGFGFLSFEDEISVERVTQEHFINLNGKQVEIKRAEPRDGSGKLGGGGGGGGGAPGEGQWGPPTAAPISIVQGHNGQMGGPPLNMPMAGPNIMQGYQGWGASPGQGNYNYSAAAAAAAGGPGYTGWGAPPAPQPQWQAAQYQPHSQHAPHAAPPQTQAYGTYGQGYTNSNYNSGPAGGSTGGNWNNWNMPQNSTSTASGEVYGGGGGARGGGAQGGAQASSTPALGAQTNSALSSKSSDYGGYAQYPPPQQPYQQEQGSTYGGQVRSYGGAGAGVGVGVGGASEYHPQGGVTPHHHPQGGGVPPPQGLNAPPNKHFANDFNKEWPAS